MGQITKIHKHHLRVCGCWRNSRRCVFNRFQGAPVVLFFTSHVTAYASPIASTPTERKNCPHPSNPSPNFVFEQRLDFHCHLPQLQLPPSSLQFRQTFRSSELQMFHYICSLNRRIQLMLHCIRLSYLCIHLLLLNEQIYTPIASNAAVSRQIQDRLHLAVLQQRASKQCDKWSLLDQALDDFAYDIQSFKSPLCYPRLNGTFIPDTTETSTTLHGFTNPSSNKLIDPSISESIFARRKMMTPRRSLLGEQLQFKLDLIESMARDDT